MHTLREPLLKKQSCPESAVSVGSAPNRSGDTNGRTPKITDNRSAKQWMVILGVGSVMALGVVAYGNAERIDASLASVWSAVTATPIRPAAPIAKPHRSIVPRAVPSHPLVNQAVLNYQRAVKQITRPARPLPQWVQTAIVNDEAALTKARKSNGALSARITQIHTQNQQLALHVRQLQGTVMNDQIRINQLEGQLHAVATRPRQDQGSSVTRKSGAGIVALQAVPSHAGATVAHRVTPLRPAKGWVVVAIHGDKAVLQTPGGQVALVKQGQVIAGKTVDEIDDTAKTVTMSGGLVAHIFGK